MRTFIIERSSFAGMGQYASKWLGDNTADVQDMGFSVSSIMLMNIFGIPLVGADICGFIGDTTPELCARWHVVGSYYPFSRNHNALGQLPQEPWQFTEVYEGSMTYLDIMKQAIKDKYSLIRYYYSYFFLASLQTNGLATQAFFKPLFFEFSDDILATQNIN